MYMYVYTYTCAYIYVYIYTYTYTVYVQNIVKVKNFILFWFIVKYYFRIFHIACLRKTLLQKGT